MLFSKMPLLIFMEMIYVSLSIDVHTTINKDDTRIVGGDIAQHGAVPYQVSLRTLINFHFCGGSVITDKWILTAGHCGSGRRPRSLNAVVGTNSLRKGGTHYTITKIIIHKDFDMISIKNDIALLMVKGVINFNELVKPIKLPLDDTDGDADVTLTGWGRLSISNTGIQPIDLQIIQLKSLSISECRLRLVDINPVFDSQICSLTHKGEGACYGDSGGPLVDDNTLVGIVSWGLPCANGYPDVYTRVYSYIEWIKQYTLL